MIFKGSLLVDLLEILLALAVVFVAFFKWSFQYWKRKNFPYLEPAIPFGNLPMIHKRVHIGIHVKGQYDEAKRRGWKHFGIYFMTSPAYFPVDLDVVKNVLTKDFQYFTDRGGFFNEEADPLSAHLFALGGFRWRTLRTKLSPTFTSGKLKSMFQTLVDCEVPFRECVAEYCEKKEPVDIKEMVARFTTDVIGSCAFGLDCNSFKVEDSPFRRYSKKVFVQNLKMRLTLMVGTIFPRVGKLIGARFTTKDTSDFFIKVVEDTVAYREKNNVVRNDFMQLLIDLKNGKMNEEALTMNEVAAQSFLFFLAGFETSSTTTTFTMYELARHQDIQQKVRDEINEVLKKHDGKLTYDSIMDMKYMNQVIDEALRKYPPVPFITRECVKDYKVPDEDVVIETGTRVLIPIYGIHHDPEYYPDPEKYDPERFNEENKNRRHQYAHIPFGEGPRICIGLRFGIMQTKVALASLLKNHKFTVDKKTQEPIKFDFRSFILAAEDDIWLNVEKV